MTTLVTGGAGYIGSHAVLALRAIGEDVVVLDDLSTGQRENVPPDTEFHLGDAGDEATVRQLIQRRKIDAIMHFAGSVVVPESIVKPLSYYHNNTVKSRALVAAAVAEGTEHMIFSSTAAVYGMSKEGIVPESAETRPISPYGSSKLMTEVMLADAAKAHAFRFVALRYFNVAGADPGGRAGQSTRRATHLIKVACQTALGLHPQLNVYGADYPTPDGTGVRDYIHVSDLAEAHVAALRYLRDGGEPKILNCGYGRGYSVLEVIDAVKRISGRAFKVVMAPRRDGDPASLVAGTGLIDSTLAWTPRFADLDTIVRHAYAWEARLKEKGAALSQ